MSRVRLTVASYVVLGIIALRGPSTSYDLKRAVGHSVGYFWPFPHAQLYSEPKRLVGLGLLEVETEQEGRRRQVFRLTDAGLQSLRRWLAQPTPEEMQVRDVAELKLFFGEFAAADDLTRLAHEQVARHTERLSTYEGMLSRFGSQEGLAYRMAPLGLGLALEKAALAFWRDYLASAEGPRAAAPTHEAADRRPGDR